jgi:hypothetical protein
MQQPKVGDRSSSSSKQNSKRGRKKGAKKSGVDLIDSLSTPEAISNSKPASKGQRKARPQRKRAPSTALLEAIANKRQKS